MGIVSIAGLQAEMEPVPATDRSGPVRSEFLYRPVCVRPVVTGRTAGRPVDRSKPVDRSRPADRRPVDLSFSSYFFI